MKFRVAAVSFLNTIPLIDSLMSDVDVPVALTRALPSRLAAMLESGTADVALVPVIEIFRGRAAGLVPGTGIACRGAVDSVKLFYRGPLSEMTQVKADRGSRSSVALLNILLREMHGIAADFRETEPVPGDLPSAGEGLLVIGDRCFEFDRFLRHESETGVQALDLGQAWWEFTGLPFVFATWAVSDDFLARASQAEIAQLIDLLTAARDKGLSRLPELAGREAALGRLGHKGEATAAAVAYYFRESLQYRLGAEEMAGLARFHELCIKHGVVPDGPAPLILRG